MEGQPIPVDHKVSHPAITCSEILLRYLFVAIVTSYRESMPAVFLPLPRSLFLLFVAWEFSNNILLSFNTNFEFPLP